MNTPLRVQPKTWTREAITDAIREWTAAHGCAPSAREWRSNVPGYPTAPTVRSEFGSWRAALSAANVEFVRKNAARAGRDGWTRDEILDAIFRWAFHHGQPPLAGEWVVSVKGFPTEWWVRRHFGTWNAAMVAAGYEPRLARRSSRSYEGLAREAAHRVARRAA